jgi:hypothetical protein
MRKERRGCRVFVPRGLLLSERGMPVWAFCNEVLFRYETRLLLFKGIDYIVPPTKGSFLSLLS